MTDFQILLYQNQKNYEKDCQSFGVGSLLIVGKL